jgi:hypothetical protein
MHLLIIIKQNIRKVWWHTSVIPALRRLKQEDVKFKAYLNYIVRLCLKIKIKRV